MRIVNITYAPNSAKIGALTAYLTQLIDPKYMSWVTQLTGLRIQNAEYAGLILSRANWFYSFD